MKTYNPHALHFCNIPMWLLAMPNLGLTAKVVYGTLNYLAHIHTEVFPSVEELCKIMGVANTTILRGIKELEVAELIKIVRPTGADKLKHLRSKYTFLRHGAMEKALAEYNAVPVEIDENSPECRNDAPDSGDSPPPAPANCNHAHNQNATIMYERNGREELKTKAPLASTPNGAPKNSIKRRSIQDGMDDSPQGKPKGEQDSIVEYQQAFNTIWKKHYQKDYLFAPHKDVNALRRIKDRGVPLAQFKILTNIFLEEKNNTYYKGHSPVKMDVVFAELYSLLLPQDAKPAVKPVTKPTSQPTSQPAPPAKPVERVYANRVTKAEENLELFHYDGYLTMAQRIKDPEDRRIAVERAEAQEARLLLALAKAKREEKLNPTWTDVGGGVMVPTRKIKDQDSD